MDPHQRRPRAREVRVQPHQRLHRKEEPHLVRHERDERPQRRRLRDDPVAPVQEDGGRPRLQEHPRQAPRQVRVPAHRQQRPHEPVVVAPEARRLPLLGVGRHHRPHPLQRLDEEAPDVRAPLPQVRHPPLEPVPVPHQRPQARRQRHEPRQEEPRVEIDEHPHRPDQEEHVPEQAERRVRRHPLDLADVAVDARDDVPERRPRVEARREPLQVAVERQPHVEQDAGRHPRVPHPARHVRPEAEDGDPDEEADDPEQEREVPAQDRVVDHRLRQVGEGEPERGAGRGEEDHGKQSPRVRSNVGEGSAKVRVPDHPDLTGSGAGISPDRAPRRRSSCPRPA